jgi:hypothetical protein
MAFRNVAPELMIVPGFDQFRRVDRNMLRQFSGLHRPDSPVDGFGEGHNIDWNSK